MDRDILLFEKMNEIYDKKISFMIESLDTQLKINMLEAQYKVVTENGTKEDFEYLYMEAKEETKEKKKGIFNGIIEWVTKIKNRLVDFFKEKKIEKQIDKLPDKVEVDKSQDEQFKGFKRFHEWLVKPINLFKQKKYKDLTVDLLKKGAEIVAVCTGVAALNIHVQFNKSEIKDRINWILKNFKTDCDSVIKMLKSNDDDSAPIKILKKVVSWISNSISAAVRWCSKIAGSNIISSPVLSKVVNKEIEYDTYKQYKDYYYKGIDKKANDSIKWYEDSYRDGRNTRELVDQVINNTNEWRKEEKKKYKKQAKEDAKFELQRAKNRKEL